MTASRRPGKKSYFVVTALALLLVLLPFLFWYETWFGRKLTDAQLTEYFADVSHPRHAQHALVQLGERLSRGADVSRWYPDVVRESASPSLELRQTAAWIMGQDRRYPPFHAALLRLIHDPEPMVRRNAALALAAFRDPAARPELDAMLAPFTVAAPAAGVVHYRLKPGEYVNPGTFVARIGDSEVRAAVPGEARQLDRPEGAAVRAGDPLVELAPDRNHVWEALRALVLVGEPADLDAIALYTRPVEGMPAILARQAAETAAAIRTRQPAP